MNLQEALPIAERVRAELEPYCWRCEIAGSIRRRCPEVNDIEIVCIPKPYETGLFASGIARVVRNWRKIRGELPCRYTRRRLPEGIELDLFFARQDNWGLIFAIRTGSARFTERLACRWVQRGCHSRDGMLHDAEDVPVPIREEEDLFAYLGLAWIPPEERV